MASDTRHTRPLLALLFFGTLMGALDLSVIAPALPAIEAEFGLENRLLAVLLNAYVLCQMISTPLLAKLADRFGARSIYVFSLALFALGSLLLVVATDAGGLFLGRAVQGFGAGGIFPAAASVIGARLPRDQRGPALGILGAVFGLAFIVGPVLGGILLRFDWRWLFLINLPLAALLIAGAYALIPANGVPGTERKPVDYAGIATLSVGLAALVLATGNFNAADVRGSLLSLPVGGALLVAIVFLRWFWQYETRAADPVIRPGLFRSRQISLSCIIAIGAGALQSAGAFYPALAVAGLGITEADAAWLLLPGVAAATIGAPVAGNLVNRFGTRNVIAASCALTTVSVAMYAFLDVTTTTFVTASVIGGMGSSGLVGAPIRLIMLNEARADERAATQGLLTVSMSSGRLFGAAIVGAIATAIGGGASGYQAGFAGMTILAAGLVLVSFALNSRTREQQLCPTGADL